MKKAGGIPIVLAPYHGQTTKQQQLQDSFARSHAARISHWRRRTRDGGQTSAAVDDDPASLDQEDSGPHAERLLNPHPRTILSETNTDPFHGDPFRELSPTAAQSLEYTYQVLWPRNSPAMTAEALRVQVDFWKRTAVQSGLTFHTQVAQATSLCYCLSTPVGAVSNNDLLAARFKHQSISMRLIREAIAKLEAPASDSLIENIMRVGANGAYIKEADQTSRYEQTPMKQGFPQFDLYGRFEISTPHLRILRFLVQQRGGLDNLNASVSQPLQMLDISTATRRGSRPIFPLLKDLRSLSDNQLLDLDSSATILASSLGKAWDTISSSLACLVPLARRAAMLTAALDQTELQRPGHLPYPVLCALSLVFQHDLYCKNASPSFFEIREDDRDDTFNIGRIALQLYSELVIFPLSGDFAGRQRLIVELRSVLTRYDSLRVQGAAGGEKDNNMRFILWATVMGAIASENTGHRDWYLKQTWLVSSREIVYWDELTTVLKDYLWWDRLFEEHTRDIWKEAQSFAVAAGS